LLVVGQDRPLTFVESAAAGGLAGAGEVFFPGHILSALMNKIIANQPVVWHQLHKGGFTNAAAQFPITAVVNTVSVKGSQAVESWQRNQLAQWQQVAMALVSGVAGGVVDTVSNGIQLYQQKEGNERKNALHAYRELSGKRLRGFSPNSFKEAKFALAWLMGAQKGEELAKEYVDNPKYAKYLGGAGVGVITAVATHPWAVLRNKMQGDLSKMMYPTTLQTAQKIYKQEGVSGFFRGLPPRGLRVVIAVPLYAKYKEILEKKIKE
jgi:hypothetical protein